MAEIALRVSNLSVPNKPNPRCPRRFALDGISFEVARGQLFLVVGGACSGKTTLMGCLGNDATLHASSKESVQYTDGMRFNNVTDIDSLRQKFGDSLGNNCVIIKDGFQWETPNQVAMLQPIRDAGATLVVSTEIHRLPSWHKGVDRILLLAAGKICLLGNPAEVRAHISEGISLDGISVDDIQTLQGFNWNYLEGTK